MIEHWDEFNLLEVFEQIAGRRLEKRKDNEPLDVAAVSSWHSKHSSCARHGHVLFDYRPFRSQIGFAICRNRSHGFLPHVRRRADADLGRLGDLIQPLAGRIKQEWAALVLSRIPPNADSVRHSLQSLVKTN
jgi:hypothetical protein